MCASFCHFKPPNLYKVIFKPKDIIQHYSQKCNSIFGKRKNKKESPAEDSLLFLLLCH